MQKVTASQIVRQKLILIDGEKASYKRIIRLIKKGKLKATPVLSKTGEVKRYEILKSDIDEYNKKHIDIFLKNLSKNY